jgi:hypothetical protein
LAPGVSERQLAANSGSFEHSYAGGAERLSVPYDTLRRHWRDWGLRGTKIGKRIQFRVRDLDKYNEGHPA